MTKPEIKVPEGVLEEGLRYFREARQRVLDDPHAPEPQEREWMAGCLAAALEQLVEEVLGDEAVQAAQEGFNADYSGPGRHMGRNVSLPHPDRIAGALNAALDHVLGGSE